MASAVEGHTNLNWATTIHDKLKWKAVTDVVKEGQEEVVRILQVQELQNLDQVPHIILHLHSSSPIRASLDEASPDLGGETLLENFLLHQPTLSEPLDGQGVEHCQEILKQLRAAQELLLRV